MNQTIANQVRELARDRVAAPYTVPADTALANLDSDPERGLTSDEATRRRASCGFNELAEAPPVSLWKKFLGQFNELMIWILIAAALIAGALGEWPDALAILAIVLLNALLGFLQEERAERALAALQRLSAPQAKLIRDGVLEAIRKDSLQFPCFTPHSDSKTQASVFVEPGVGALNAAS